MKKIIFSLVALVAAMSMNAQIMKVYKDGAVVASYTAAQMDSVVYAEASAVVTTGTAKATINGSEVDVNWVQLWAGGPKFAEYNVGASSATDQGTAMTFTNATETGVNYVWGANWYTAGKDDMDELVKAASKTGSTKVKCEYVEVSGKYGFKFTGKETGYNTNSVFFPVQNGTTSAGYEYYWSGTADGNNAWRMGLILSPTGGMLSAWNSSSQGNNYFVRPVLVEE